MEKLILAILAIIPVVILARYVNSKDRNKEPTKLLIALFLSGIAACFLVLFISGILDRIFPILDLKTTAGNYAALLIQIFVGVALVEEGCKLLMTYSIAYRHKEFDEIYDIIVYAVFVALGFACFENILYVLGNGAVDFAAGARIGVLRGLLSVPGHACDGLFMGYYLSLAKIAELQNNKQNEKKYKLYSLLIPTLLHGIYDFCCMAGSIFILVFIIFVVWLYKSSIKKLKLVAANNRSLIFQNKYCPNCKTPQEGMYCSNCGQRLQ